MHLDLDDAREIMQALDEAVCPTCGGSGQVPDPDPARTMSVATLQQARRTHSSGPFRAPHYTASARAMRQEVGMAEGGMLFLDQLEDFGQQAILAISAALKGTSKIDVVVTPRPKNNMFAGKRWQRNFDDLASVLVSRGLRSESMLGERLADKAARVDAAKAGAVLMHYLAARRAANPDEWRSLPDWAWSQMARFERDDLVRELTFIVRGDQRSGRWGPGYSESVLGVGGASLVEMHDDDRY
jgi:hypothetical protein